MTKQPRTITMEITNLKGLVRHETVPVLARVGPFAVHQTVLRNLPLSRDLFTVTHAETGLAADVYILSLAAAKSLARRLVESGANWNFSSPAKMSQRTKRIGIAAYMRWREAQRRKAG